MGNTNGIKLKEKKHRVTITGMPDSIFLWIFAIAKQRGISMSAVIKSILSEAMLNEKM